MPINNNAPTKKRSKRTSPMEEVRTTFRGYIYIETHTYSHIHMPPSRTLNINNEQYIVDLV